MIFLALLLLSLLPLVHPKLRPDGLCDGNRFVYLSTYVLGLQTDLRLTFADINTLAKVDEVYYQEELFKSYRIFNFKQNIVYNEGRQSAKLVSKNVLRVSGGNVRISYTFDWTKTQLGSSLNGTGTGSVSSDIISYQKTLETNVSHELQWHLTYSQPLVITNGLSLLIDPYRVADYEILSNMLNKLKNNQTTIKDNLLRAINLQLQAILAKKVLQDETIKFEKQISYEYLDYRGKFDVSYTNTLMNSTLADDGLYLLFSQVIDGYDDFECGQTVPFEPNDPQYYGGLQQFISNSLIKSTLRRQISKGALDVILNEEFWQSRAFQFYIGDLHDVMPSSTKSIPTMQEINGSCKAKDDPVFSFAMKNTKSYEAKVNFACTLQFNRTKLIDINLVANYQISPKLTTKTLDIQLTGLTGAPAFIESSPFKIQYQQLAEFMVSETINLAKSGFVFGTGYKMKYPRKHPSLWVRGNYLFLYDSSATPRKAVATSY